MTLPEPSTYFASPDRTDPEELAQTAEACINNPVVTVILDTLDGSVLVLDWNRQILAANPTVLKEMGLDDAGSLLGARPGEALGCVHAPEGPAGCGTSRHCRACGLVLSVLTAQASHGSVEGECLMDVSLDERFEGREFHVKVTPIDLDGRPILVAVLHDISDTKRREVMESAFLHDLSNILQGLQNWSELLQCSVGNPATAAHNIASISHRISQEVAMHRLILQAERGELTVRAQPLGARTFLEELCLTLEGHDALKGKTLQADPVPQEDAFTSDPVLLRRVLTNMLVNALEATPPGGRVRIAFDRRDGRARFRVQNPGLIPPDAALKIFHRSFSTKAAKGRGLGTYAMKLLGENYLRGKVTFTCSDLEGTTFFIELPSQG